jgi:outer membrane protein assembly factor BamA
VAINSFYGSGGSWLASFSDLMGDQQIVVQGDLQQDLTQYAHLYASYLNMKYRLNWGAGALYNRALTSENAFGDSLFYDTDGGGFGMLRFPFSRFSRCDASLFYQYINREPYLVYVNAIYADPYRSPIIVHNLISSLSYSFDNILWGITGPLNGLRGRLNLTASPPLEPVTHSYIAADGDIRYYWHLFKRFVWANRVAAGASQPLREGELSQRRFFLGGTENWLFYEVNNREYSNNIKAMFYSDMIVPLRGWKYLDHTGTRFAVLNSEFRFPFIKEFTIAWPLPLSLRYVNGALFADVGNAWDPGDEYAQFPLPRSIFGGVGFGMRANLGIFVLRFDRAWKTDFTAMPYGPKNYFSLGAEF